MIIWGRAPLFKGISKFIEYVRLFFFLPERGIIAQKHKICVISAKMYVTFW